MSQVPVKWVTQNSLMDPYATKNFMAWKDRPAHYIPVVELSALREWLTRFSCVCAHSNIHSSQEWDHRHENWCPQLKAQRLLASLGEVGK